LAIGALALSSSSLLAQHQHHQPAKPAPAPTATPSNTQTEQEQKAPAEQSHGHDAPAEKSPHDDHHAMDMMATVSGGPFRSMRALGSGTSLQPASAPMWMWHWMPGEWMVMLHGEFKVGFNHQGGPRGVGKAESQNWLMAMAERKAGPGRLMLRGMFSAEPLTMPHGGSPQLFQSGETYRGRPIVDAQHPHDVFMELAASYTIPLSERVSFQVYGGPVGEPALGPVAFMHRASAAENPAAPLGHHYQDSTHIAHGVVTAALTAGRFKFEGSVFNGREPDENRATIELDKLDSWSFRTWYTPTPNWAMQFSYGRLVEPESIEPGDIKRMTASVSYNRPLKKGNWASALVWGRNSKTSGDSNSYLLESTVNFLRKNYLYTRAEVGDREGLLINNVFGRRGAGIPPGSPDEHKAFHQMRRVSAFTFGGVRDLLVNEFWRVGLGADVTLYDKPASLDSIYGRQPASYRVFLRFRPGAKQ
jgi:hypothetical protein